MFLFLTGIFTIFMILVWGFFIIAKINFYKFRDYSAYIVPSTKILTVILIILTFFGYYEVYRYSQTNEKTKTVQESAVNEVY
ncbi:MAG: hypothetical protein PHS92_04785 [Candidatus Gracilibacteria bacterium]|nr:hypothetical protein [Candidatus Gracilibacteria bacterium]